MNFSAGLTQHPEHANVIANIIARWNVIEDLFQHLFALFVGNNDLVLMDQIFGSLNSSKARLDILDSSGKHALVNNKNLPEFIELIQSLQVRLKKRNTYAHGIYGVDDDGKLWLTCPKYDWRDTQKGGHCLQLNELQEELLESISTFNAFIQFQNKIFSEIHEHQRTSFVTWSLPNQVI